MTPREKLLTVDNPPLMQRSLGRSGLKVSRLGLGCATFGREIDEERAFALMDYALDHGITLFDTAEAYGGGQAKAYRREKLGVDDSREVSDEMHSSEKIVGRWLRDRGARDRITLVTKVTTHFTREHVREALEASLQRLQTGWVDLYLYHRHDPSVTAADANAAMDAVIEAGLARAAGCSNYSAAQLQAALESGRHGRRSRFEAVEFGYNLIQSQSELFSLAEREELGILAYSPLAAGFLSGKYVPDRGAVPKGTRFDVIPGHADVYFSERSFRRVTLLHEMAARIGLPPLQLAMAWVLDHPLVTTVLVGARTEAHLTNALDAAKVRFDPEWRQEIAGWDSADPA